MCAVTRAQARNLEDVVDLGDSLLVSPDQAVSSPDCGGTPLCKENASVTVELQPNEEQLKFSAGKEELIRAQKCDDSVLLFFPCRQLSKWKDLSVLSGRWSCPPAPLVSSIWLYTRVGNSNCGPLAFPVTGFNFSTRPQHVWSFRSL